MSRFKVGDRVRCVSAAGSMSVGEIDTVFNADPHDGTMQLSKNGGWWFRQSAFELVPHPAESPDDWVTQDRETIRPALDQFRWVGSSTLEWFLACDFPIITGRRHGDKGSLRSVHDTLEVRCRRKDLPKVEPERPVEVHAGGPYVARSVYDQVCVERDDALAQAVRIRDEAVKLAAERDQIKADQESLLADLKATEQTVIHLNKRVFANAANGWPLVPVDPSCIPDGHRAVEVTCATAGKLVASSDGNARHFYGTHIVPRLVVEPIPTPPAPDALPRPEFPAWIRAGWWIAMDSAGFWYMSKDEPVASDIDPESESDEGTWDPPGLDDIQISHGITPSMRAVPRDRWRVAKWQIE